MEFLYVLNISSLTVYIFAWSMPLLLIIPITDLDKRTFASSSEHVDFTRSNLTYIKQ